MRWLTLLLLFLPALTLAQPAATGNYMEALPQASAVNGTDLTYVCQGGTGAVGTCTTRKARVNQFPTTGGGGTTSPGGTNGQIQYNNSGTFGGFTMGGDATVNTATGTMTLRNSGVIAGSYTNTNVTVNSKGLVTAIANGSSGPGPSGPTFTLFNVITYGADPTGVADSTANFNSAIAAAIAGSGCAYVPGGTYKVANLTPVSTGPAAANIYCLIGDGPSSILNATDSAGDLITVDNYLYGYISRLKITHAGGHRTSGIYLNLHIAWDYVDNVDMENAHFGIDSFSNVAHYSHITMETETGTAGTGEEFIRLHGGSGGVVIDQFFNGASATPFTQGVHVYDGQANTALTISNSDFLTVGNGLLVDNFRGCVCGGFIVNTHFDTGVNGIAFVPTATGHISRWAISNTWTSAGTGSGVYIVTDATSTVSDISFTNLVANQNTNNGAYLNGTFFDTISFVGGSFASNGQNGIEVINGNKTIIEGVQAGKTADLNGNGQAGISLNNTYNVVVTGNNAMDNGVTDIYRSPATTGIVTNNCTTASCSASGGGGGVTSLGGASGDITLNGLTMVGNVLTNTNNGNVRNVVPGGGTTSLLQCSDPTCLTVQATTFSDQGGTSFVAFPGGSVGLGTSGVPWGNIFVANGGVINGHLDVQQLGNLINGIPDGTYEYPANGKIATVPLLGGGTTSLVECANSDCNQMQATTIAFQGGLKPFPDNGQSLGFSTNRWTAVWAANGVIQTSDRSLKTDIHSEPLGLAFIRELKPVDYQWRDGRPGVHHGLIAQDVEQALHGAPFAGLIKPAANEEYYSLAYAEMIGPLIHAVQELSAKVDRLEGAQMPTIAVPVKPVLLLH